MAKARIYTSKGKIYMDVEKVWDTPIVLNVKTAEQLRKCLKKAIKSIKSQNDQE